ncbi:hypothetical protein Tco_1246071 [Tanacetum coccineum]
MIKDFDNIDFGHIMTMAVLEHFLHTKPSIDSEEFVNVFVRISFGSTIKLVSFDESQVVTFNGKFICGFRNSDCGTGSRSDNTVGSLHSFIIHGIEVFEGNEEVTEVTDVKNWRIDNSQVLRWVVSLIEWNSSVSSTKSLIQNGKCGARNTLCGVLEELMLNLTKSFNFLDLRISVAPQSYKYVIFVVFDLGISSSEP